MHYDIKQYFVDDAEPETVILRQWYESRSGVSKSLYDCMTVSSMFQWRQHYRVCYLRATRQQDGEGNVRRKRQKVAVIPGKSVSGEEVHCGLVGRAAGSSRSDKDTPDTSHAMSLNDAQLTTMTEQNEVPESDDEQNVVDSDVEQSDEEVECAEAFTTSKVEAEADVKCVATKIDIGDFVIVDYEGVKYPGVVAQVKKSGAEVSTLVQSGLSWKWPSKWDQIFYSKDEILEVIKEPVQFGRRAVFRVPEMEKYL